MAKHSKNEKTSQTDETPNRKIRFWTRHPDWSAVIALFLLLVVFFWPVISSNKTLLPPDKVASLSYLNFVPKTIPYAVQHHYYPMWNPYLFSGMPSFASLTMPFVDVVNDAVFLVAGSIQYLVHFVRPMDVKTPFYLVFNYLLLGASLYLLLRTKKIPVGASLFASAALMFMPQVMAYSAFGHNTKLATVAMIPLVFLLVERLLDRQNLLFFCLAGLAVGIQLLRAHVQISYYTLLAAGLYFIYWAVCAVKDKEKFARMFRGALLLAGAVIAGVLISSVMNLSVLEYSKYSIRGGGETGGASYDYATGWSFHPNEIVTFFNPSFLGFGGATYWGHLPFTDFPQYPGLLVVLFACLAMALKRNRTAWFFAVLAAFSLIASFGKYVPVLYGPMFKVLPFFDKFRAPNMIQILFEFSMAVLAAYGFQAVLDFPARAAKEELMPVKKVLSGFGGVLTLILLLLAAAKGSYLHWAAKAGEGALVAHGMAVNDAIRMLVFFIIACFLIWSALRKNLGKWGFSIILIVLLVADLWVCDRKFVQFRRKADESGHFAETPDVAFLKQQQGPFRILQVADSREPNWYMYHLIESVTGYHAAKLRVYQETLDAFGMPDAFLQKYIKPAGNQVALRDPGEIPQDRLRAHRAFMSMLNVKYILCPYMIPDTSFHVLLAPQTPGLPAVYGVGGGLPRVFFPKKVVPMRGRDAILGYMAGGSFDPAETAVVEEAPPFDVRVSEGNRAEIVSRDMHRISVRAEVKTPSLMVLSEVFYPAGWKATVDGREARIYKTDYVLRSIFLEPGEHTIEMVFAPKALKTGLWISLASTLLLAAGAVIGARTTRRKKVSGTVPGAAGGLN